MDYSRANVARLIINVIHNVCVNDVLLEGTVLNELIHFIYLEVNNCIGL